MAVIREYKDRLFTFMFSHEENREWTLSLYNAVNGTSYTDAGKVRINTIKDVVYLGMHNDVSFILYNDMSLYEQQSTYNPNMPLRCLQYAGNLYEKYVIENKYNKYGGTLIKLPVPKLVVFYNGMDDLPDETVLRLSDSFPEGSSADIEVRVRMLNINQGKNAGLLEACRPLYEYSWFISSIRNLHASGQEIEEAIDNAVKEMPDSFLIKDFLKQNKAEVEGMLLTEYNEAETMNLFREEGRSEGRKEGKKEGIEEGKKEGLKEGMKKGRMETLISLVKQGIIPEDVAAKQAGMSPELFARYKDR